MDRTQHALEKAAISFFSNKFPSSTINFKPKHEGSGAGIIASVLHNNKETVYFMKTYHLAGSSNELQNITPRYPPDLREMLGYRLLELIEAGLTVFFPFYAGSTYIHYIATEEVSQFQELDKMEDSTLDEKVVVEVTHFSYFLELNICCKSNFNEIFVPNKTDIKESNVVKIS